MKISFRQLIRKLAMKGSCSAYGFITIFVLLAQSAFAQQYVTSTSPSTINRVTVPIVGTVLADASIDVRNNVIGAPNSTVATMTTEGLVATIAGITAAVSSDATLNMNFTTPIPAGKRTYIRVTSITQEGLSLDLSSLVNLLGLFSNSAIRVSANGAVAPSELVRDRSGNLFIAVTPPAQYSSLALTLDFEGVTGSLIGLSLGRLTMQVEHAVTYENSNLAPCDAIPFAFTALNPRATGIELTLTDALQNPVQAIDGTVASNNFSLLQNGTVGAVSSVSQTVFLGKTSPSGNQVVATLSKPAALADVGVLENITIAAFLGGTPAGGARSITSLLDLDLLGLFQNDQLITVTFTPTGPFDRIVISSNTTVDINAFTGLRIHELGSRPPIVFTGGDLGVAIIKEAFSVNLNAAEDIANPLLVGFNIDCGDFADYTYSLFNVSAPTGRVLAGTLPSSLTLSPSGTLSGIPQNLQAGSYLFDVQARNAFGQTAVAQFFVKVESGLPVTLVSFKATSEGPSALLSWTTASETNSDRFDIERSQNGKKWAKIGSVKSNHESVTQQFYSFKDEQPMDGQNFYRLKMVDLDETFAYSHIENIKFASTAFLYPNPVRNAENVNLNLADWSKIKQVKVINVMGKTVFEASNALSTGISTRNLSSGSYVVQVIHTNGTISAHRFVRQ